MPNRLVGNMRILKKIKEEIKKRLPRQRLNFLAGRRLDSCDWSGNYDSWAEAELHSSGYNQPAILEKVKTALLRVKNKEAIYERDSVLFDHVQYSWPMLAGLMYAAAKNNGVLSVLDFGGSLGSSFFQNRLFFDGLRSVHWSIVEQEKFVICGNENFSGDQLKFYHSIQSCLEVNRPNVLLLSSVIQYLQDPYQFLAATLQFNFETVIIDRTSFSRDGRDKIVVQHVPENIYRASYPCRFLSEENFRKCFHHYHLKEKFLGSDLPTDECCFYGFIYEKNKRLVPEKN